jgi:DNA-binding CsgD family transcriptional regulator
VELARGRAAAQHGAWFEAFTALSTVDQQSPLDVQDLELLAIAAYLLGRVDQSLSVLQRAHQLHLSAGEVHKAVRCAFWIGFQLSSRGDFAQAGGWLARANRLLDEEPGECVEHAYVLLPIAFKHVVSGELAQCRELAARVIDIARRFREPDALAFGLNILGRALIYDGDIAGGMALLGEAMVGVVAGELSPPAAGNVYCSVIEACQEVVDLRGAQEWTDALSTWCDQQHGMITFTGRCMLHRAELMRLRGAWPAAIEEARRAQDRAVAAAGEQLAGGALYQQAEVHRLMGKFHLAERAYQQASHAGHQPQPGLALLRLAQGSTESAQTAIARVLAETPDRTGRARLLPAAVEIMLAAGDPEAARAAADELAELAAAFQTLGMRALADQSLGAVLLAEGEASRAVVVLLRAWQAWRDLDAPYEAARVRVQLGRTRRQLRDDEAAALDIDAARAVFAQLGAQPDLQRLAPLAARADGLTAREREVLRLLAMGKTNAAIASDLVLSAKTVDRHVSNIFAKLGVSSRAAATAYAYQHHLA